MNRIMQVMVALLAIAAIATPVMAEDRLSLSGSMRVRGFYQDVDNGLRFDDSAAWNDQRLRVGGKISVAEGVSVNFRFDATESIENSSDGVAWGGDQSYISSRAKTETIAGKEVTANRKAFAPYSNRRADIQFDKAYLQLEKFGYTLTAGQQYFGFLGTGTGSLLDTVGAGFMVKRGPVTLVHVKETDNTNGVFVDTGLKESSITGAKFDFKGDGFTVTPMVSYSNVSGDGDLLGLGLTGSVNLGVVALKGEIDYFDGETDGVTDPKHDLKGLQVYLDASMALNETVTVGGILLYAQSQDGTDEQVTYQKMPVFVGFSPLTYGYSTGDFVDGYTRTLNPYKIAGADNAGMQALQLYTDVKLSDDLMLKGAAAYAQTDDDDIADIDGYILNGSVSYALMENTSLTGHINYSSFDYSGQNDLQTIQAISGLTVKF